MKSIEPHVHNSGKTRVHADLLSLELTFTLDLIPDESMGDDK